MDPGLEAVRLPQVRDPAPGEDEGVLQRVLGETGVAQDPMSDRVERVADLVHQDGERLTIAPRACSTRSRSTSTSGGARPEWPGSPTMTGASRPERSVRSSRRRLAPSLEQDDVAPAAAAVLAHAALDADPPEPDRLVQREARRVLGHGRPANSVQKPASSDAGMRRRRSAWPTPWPRASSAT